jgi:predicted component of type VI protein secretion system
MSTWTTVPSATKVKVARESNTDDATGISTTAAKANAHSNITQHHTLGAAATAAEAPESTSTIQARTCLASILVATSVAVMLCEASVTQVSPAVLLVLSVVRHFFPVQLYNERNKALLLKNGGTLQKPLI